MKRIIALIVGAVLFGYAIWAAKRYVRKGFQIKQDPKDESVDKYE